MKRKNKKINKVVCDSWPHPHSYESLYDCIVSDQVPPEDIAFYFEDMGFKKYYDNRKTGALHSDVVPIGTFGKAL